MNPGSVEQVRYRPPERAAVAAHGRSSRRSDSRQGLSRQQIDTLHVGQDFGTENSESIMLLHMGCGRPALISAEEQPAGTGEPAERDDRRLTEVPAREHAIAQVRQAHELLGLRANLGMAT